MNRTFEIRKAGLDNKGAAMMLTATAQSIRMFSPGARIVVAPDETLPFEPRARLGLWHRPEFRRLGMDFSWVFAGVPQHWRTRYGVVLAREIDVVLDAAGLAYSDQWGSSHAVDLANRLGSWRKQGIPLILLPQAFGPFTRHATKEAMKRVAEYATLIYARDKTSYELLVDVVGSRDGIRIGPDFTADLPPRDLGSRDLSSKAVAVIPNARMLDKTSEIESNAYLDFLRRSIGVIREAGLSPFFLIHEGQGDLVLATKLNQMLTHQLDILVPCDGQEAKAIILGCEAILASRYHALVSALSQSVVAVGTGWNHKYRALFDDYRCPELLVSVSLNDEDLRRALRPIVDDEMRAAIKHRLQEPAERIRIEIQQMWREVFAAVSEL